MWERFEDLGRDARHAVRGLVRNPGFAITATIVLMLGIGANTTMFTVVNTLFLEPAPLIPDADRLVRVNRTSQGTGFRALAYPDYRYYRENNEVFDGILAYDPDGVALTISADGALRPGRGWFVSDNYFDVLGVRPAAGRWFLPEEDRDPGTHAVAVISHGLWRQTFGSDPGAVGSSMELNGHSFTVVGVAPEGFRGASPIETPPDVWFPIHTQPILTPLSDLFALRRVPGNTWVWLWGVARLRDGVSIEVAQASIDGLASHLEDTYPEWNEGWGVVLSPSLRFHPPSGTSLATMTRLLFAVVALVLLIAGANVAILMLARGSTHMRDMGVRSALGAGRARLVRASLAESLVLALVGGLLGLVVAYWSAGAVARIAPMEFAVDFRPDGTVFAFTLLVATLAACLFGFVPARQLAKVDVNSVLKGETGREGGRRTRNLLVVAQMAMSLALVVAAGLFARSLATASNVELGFETEDRVLVGVQLRSHGYSPDEGRAFIRDALERVRRLPGVRTATTTNRVPFRGSWSTTVALPAGVAGPRAGATGGGPDGAGHPDGGQERIDVGLNAVSSDYFRAMGMTLVSGRGFSDSDGPGGGVNPVVINEALAERMWPGENAIGRIFGQEEDRPPFTVIGIVADATYYELGESPTPHAWLPVQTVYQSGVYVLAETDGRAGVAADIQRELHAIDRTLAFTSVSTMREVVGNEFGRYRMAAIAVGAFGVLALLLASAGLYGVLSYTVSRRTREIGVRVALGATRSSVGIRVVSQGLRLAFVGTLIGLAAAVAGGRLIASFLYGVSPRDPVTMIGVPLILLVVAVLAAAAPAWRATRVDPIEALSAEA